MIRLIHPFLSPRWNGSWKKVRWLPHVHLSHWMITEWSLNDQFKSQKNLKRQHFSLRFDPFRELRQCLWGCARRRSVDADRRACRASAGPPNQPHCSWAPRGRWCRMNRFCLRGKRKVQLVSKKQQQILKANALRMIFWIKSFDWAVDWEISQLIVKQFTRKWAFLKFSQKEFLSQVPLKKSSS